jgi:hypothetical protein
MAAIAQVSEGRVGAASFYSSAAPVVAREPTLAEVQVQLATLHGEVSQPSIPEVQARLDALHGEAA